MRDAAYRGFDPMIGLGLATFGWGWHLEAATSALRLILRGTLDRHLDLQIVLGHWGELLPFWLDRADGLSRLAGLERPISDYVRTNVFLTASTAARNTSASDTSTSPSPTISLPCASA